MKPIDNFSFVKNNQVSKDMTNLIRLYLPIIGSDATVVYQYLISFYDDGKSSHKIAEILNHTLLDLPHFEAALAILTGMDLLALYQDMSDYLIELKEPLTPKVFLSNAVYRRLLESHIGDVAVADLEMPELKGVRDISKKFSEVFSDKGEIDLQPSRMKNSFDLDSFKNRMAADGLHFDQEKQDVIALYNISEKFSLTWFDVYQLAKETASRHTILPKRILTKLNQPKKVSKEAFSQSEKIILSEAKSSSPEIFLAKIKRGRQAMVMTADEAKILDELAQMSFLDEVINIMVLYTFNKTKSANLNRRYIMKLANDFAFQKITTAEQAVEKMRDSGSQSQTKGKPQRVNKTASSIPEWSNPDYKDETTPEEQAKLDEMKRQMLAKLRKDGE
ncbi:DnaD domain protein [Streptococcus dentapri]|uniref:DnaD domain protein n=1 Tax=Streptococcus dentapri TaxID=573564 RepID=A0ABV8D0W4_9STRE